jgi:hypothetical protein
MSRDLPSGISYAAACKRDAAALDGLYKPLPTEFVERLRKALEQLPGFSAMHYDSERCAGFVANADAALLEVWTFERVSHDQTVRIGVRIALGGTLNVIAAIDAYQTVAATRLERPH